MKVLALLGSRNHEGQTAMATQALLDGLEEKGSRTEKKFLPELAVERCRQCDEDGY